MAVVAIKNLSVPIKAPPERDGTTCRGSRLASPARNTSPSGPSFKMWPRCSMRLACRAS